MLFHPYSTRNSTTYKHLIIRAVTIPGWKGGIINEKNYFSWKRMGKVLTGVKYLDVGSCCFVVLLIDCDAGGYYNKQTDNTYPSDLFNPWSD